MFDNGREHSGFDVVDWAVRGEKLGAGEILITSVDQDGMMAGMDLELIEAISCVVNIPVIACGGVRDATDVIEAEKRNVSGVAVGSILHYKKTSVKELKINVMEFGGSIRL